MLASLVPTLLGVLLLGFALYRIWQAVTWLRRKTASETWPVLAAEVVSKRVIESRSSRSGTSFRPEVTYRYTVMGQPVERRLRLRGIYYRQSADKALEDLGNNIEVRYNPDNPGEHITAMDKFTIWNVLLIVGILILALFLLLPLVLK